MTDEVKLAYARFRQDTPAYFGGVTLLIDYDRNGRIIGVEVLADSGGRRMAVALFGLLAALGAVVESEAESRD